MAYILADGMFDLLASVAVGSAMMAGLASARIDLAATGRWVAEQHGALRELLKLVLLDERLP